MGVNVGVAVGEATGCTVGVFGGIADSVGVSVGVAVQTGVLVGVMVGVHVNVGVSFARPITVAEGVPAVCRTVAVWVGIGVSVAILLGVGVTVGATVKVRVIVGGTDVAEGVGDVAVGGVIPKTNALICDRKKSSPAKANRTIATATNGSRLVPPSRLITTAVAFPTAGSTGELTNSCAMVLLLLVGM